MLLFWVKRRRLVWLQLLPLFYLHQNYIVFQFYSQTVVQHLNCFNRSCMKLYQGFFYGKIKRKQTFSTRLTFCFFRTKVTMFNNISVRNSIFLEYWALCDLAIQRKHKISMKKSPDEKNKQTSYCYGKYMCTEQSVIFLNKHLWMVCHAIMEPPCESREGHTLS